MAARYVGAHVSTAKGLGNAVRDGKAMGCTAVQVFTSSPRQWKALPPTQEKIADMRAAVKETGINEIVSHDTYLVNLCHPEQETAEKSRVTLKEELDRSAAYGIPYVVSHMGSLKDQELAPALLKVSEVTVEMLKETPDHVMLLMETTAGQGSAINSRFEELAMLLELCQGHPRLGVCMDTCHIFVAGYDIRTPETYSETMAKFDKIVGLDRLKVIHLNDSKKGFNSRVDRHEHIGKGELGPEAFRSFMNDPRLEEIPMVLETEAADEGHEKDLATLHSLMQ